MHEMRLAKREITGADELRNLVESCQVLHVGAVDDEGMFIVPVNYGYLWHGRRAADAEGAPIASFYIHSARQGRKASCWSANGAAGTPVAIELDRDDGNIVGDYACAFSRAYASIMGTGRIVEVADEAERARGLKLLMEHAAPGALADFAPESMARVAIFRIDATRLTGKKREPNA